jgi:NAD+ synthase
MTDQLSIALAQLNPTVGDIAGNAAKLRSARAEAAKLGADLLVGTELCVAGYPPEDLVLKPAFQDAVEEAVEALARETSDSGPALIVGAPWRSEGKLYNAALLLEGGRITFTRFKHELPNYGVFDEKRVFAAGPAPGPIVFKGVRLGLQICEDMWLPDVSETLAETGAEILVVINGSPFEADKGDERIQLALQRVHETGLPLIYVNQVCGQDELVFDGASFALNADDKLAAQARAWREEVLLTQWCREESGWRCVEAPIERVRNGLDSIYQAMMLGVRDYVNKNGFAGTLIGLSGGIDSALTAAVAVDALGAERVHCVRLPSRYTSTDSMEDAEAIALLLGTKLDTVSIAPAVAAFDGMLAPALGSAPKDLTAENIQPRARALVLMAMSNATGKMLLTTGNKSEISVGYATLYGDMCGGYNVLKDVYKTTVFALSRWRNQVHPEGALGPEGRVMPERVLTKAPTAELKPNQTDQDTLPPYEMLDGILECLIEREMRPVEIAARGFDLATVKRVWRMLDLAEYKRRQAAPGVKLTRRAFGRDRRYPITNRFKG